MRTHNPNTSVPEHNECTVRPYFKSPAIANFQIAQTILRFINRYQIQKRLARMLIGTITGINHRYTRKFSRHTGRTVFRVSLNNRIRIAGNNPRSIRKRFTLFRTGIRTIGKTDNFPTQTLYRRFKR